MMKIAVIGTGYVGLVTAACLADLGNTVICVDNDHKKLDNLKKGIMPIYEAGLEEMIKKNCKLKKISFNHSIKAATEKSDIIFICVGTPANAEGGADLSAVEKVATEIGRAMKSYKLVVSKSTVPVHTGDRIQQTLSILLKNKNLNFDVASNPEFLREGQAVHDTLYPDRIVIGVATKRAEQIMRNLYKPIKAPIVITNIETAEIIKHACNCFLSTKISFINAIANICERVNADVEKVAEGMGLDKRIGRAFLNAGAGFGGYCFPKDLDAFIHIAAAKGYDFELLKAVRKINESQKMQLIKKIEEALWILRGKTIAVWGLSFKPKTDDIRNSIAIAVIKILQDKGVKIKAYDPQALEKAREELKGVKFCQNPYETLKKSDCLVIMTEWEDFLKVDLNKVKKCLNQPVIIDGRNMFDPQLMKKKGFIYKCFGRNQAI